MAAEARGEETHSGMPAITIRSLLAEMIDRDSMARWPLPPFACKQQSSYDRHRTGPDKPDWFANHDFSQYIRVKKHGAREEHVMMEADGPGAIVRIWITTDAIGGKLRVYLDGAEEPTIEFASYDLMQGGLDLTPPLLTPHTSYQANAFGGSTLYLPIPYARQCKITLETLSKPARYYQVNYRTYPPGTKIETFSRRLLDAARPVIAGVGKTLLDPPPANVNESIKLDQRIPPGKEVAVALPVGPAAVRQLQVRLGVPGEKDCSQALRSMVLESEFDGERTVWCPLGDFSGSGVGGRPLASWYRQVDANGTILCRWVMPYEKSARLKLLNLGKQDVHASLAAGVGDWRWDNRSMYFHATWRQQDQIPTAHPIDWNFLAVQGRGVFVGDTLAVYNPLATWYGEGNEKIWVDRDTFPSHLGTGTEDYYNASYAPVVVYQTPFANAPRADTPSSQGHNTFTRTRNLDGIPFASSLKFDMEIIPWAPGTVDYAATTYWYAPEPWTMPLRPTGMRLARHRRTCNPNRARRHCPLPRWRRRLSATRHGPIPMPMPISLRQRAGTATQGTASPLRKRNY
jgi:hypothetical protein